MVRINDILHKNLGVALLVLFMLVGSAAWSQQDPLYTQYMNNIMSVNPAYTAVRGVASISTVYRNQWIRLDGAPKSTSISFSMPVDSLNKMGLGVDFMHDYTVPLSTSMLFLNYSYRVNVAGNTTLSLGLKAGVSFLDANLDDLYRYHQEDIYIIEDGEYQSLLFNAGVGAFLYNDNFYAGFSVPRLFENLHNKDVTEVKAASREKQHYFLHGAYMIDLSNEVSFKPGLTTIMTQGAPLTADFDFSFLFHEQIWIGVMYRISDALGGYMQFQYKNIKLGFSYDYSHTRLRQFQSGTFEVLLRYDFRTRAYQRFPIPVF